MRDFATKMRIEMAKKGLKCTTLSKLTGISHDSLKRYHFGSRLPTPERQILIIKTIKEYLQKNK